MKRNSTAVDDRRCHLGPSHCPPDASLAHRVDLVDQLPVVATAEFFHLLDPEPGRGLTVVPDLLGIGAETLEAGLARDPVAYRFLVAVA